MNERLSETLAVSMYELDAEGPADVAWVAISEYSSFLAIVMRSVGTGGLDDFRILGNPAADGSGTDVVLKDASTLVTLSTVDAVGDTVMLDVTQADLDAGADSVGAPLLGISVSLGHVTATDESVITYIRGGARKKYDLLTPQSVIA